MRRVVSATFALLLLSVAETSGQVTVGLKAGFNLSDLDVENAAGEPVDWTSASAFAGGAWLQIGLGDVLAIQPELLYSPRGASQDITQGTLSLELTYLEVPVLLAARVPAGDSPIWPIVYMGTVLAFEVDCELQSGNIRVDCDAGDSPAGSTDGTDIGIAAGGGLEFFFGTIRAQLDARYTLGLNDINATGSGASVKNRGWSFLFGLGYALSP